MHPLCKGASIRGALGGCTLVRVHGTRQPAKSIHLGVSRKCLCHAGAGTETHLYRFTGSTGVAIVTREEAHLFTDGRYWIQASEQLDDNWTLQKVPTVKDWDDWLVEKSENAKGIIVGIDPTLVTYCEFAMFTAPTLPVFLTKHGTVRASALLDSLTPTGGSFTFPSRNLVDVVWGKNRPAPIDAPIFVHPLKYAGQPSQEKLEALAKWLATSGDKATNNGGFPPGSTYIINELDQIAWMLNLRGASIPCNRACALPVSLHAC